MRTPARDPGETWDAPGRVPAVSPSPCRRAGPVAGRRAPRRLAPALLLAGLAALAGCTSLTPAHERPPAPVADRFPGTDGTPATGTAAAQLDWSAYYADPALRELIARALRNNRDLRIAVLNTEAARAQLQLRRADELPTVGVGGGVTRQVTASGSISNVYSAGFNVTAYELDLFGRVRALGDAAAAQLLASEEARKAAQIALVAAVAQTHVALATDEELLALTRRTLATREESLRLTRLKFDNGVSSALDLRQAQTLVEAARVSLAAFQRQREQDRNALALLVGEPLPATYAPPRVTDLVLTDVPAGLPSEVLLARPDVRQAEQGLIAAQANIGAARAAFWPRITLTGSLGTASTALSELFKDGAWSFAAQLLLPIFDAGRNRAALASAQVQRDIAVAAYERSIQAAFRDVADALAGRTTLLQQLQAAQAQAEAEQARYGLVQLRVDNGVGNALELLDAQRSLFAAEQAVLQTRAALLQSRVGVYRALGGGWTTPGP